MNNTIIKRYHLNQEISNAKIGNGKSGKIRTNLAENVRENRDLSFEI